MENNQIEFVEETAVEEKLPLLKRRRSFAFLLNVLFYLCGFVLLVFTGFSYLYILTEIEGRSMQPLINASGENTDMAYINRIEKGVRGDIVVFKNIISNKYVIKRMLAEGGDRILIDKIGDSTVARIYLKVNGSTEIDIIDESYLAQNDGMTQRTWPNFENLRNRADLEFDSDGYLIIADGYVFCLGDNRLVSDDCSSYGPVPVSDIIGRADIIVHQGENPNEVAFLFVLKQFGLIR